jgi:hypothetical protein
MKMSHENSDFEQTLNASSVLNEIVDDENCFKLLINDGSLELMMKIACQGESNAQNAPYIKNLLANVIH